MKYVGINLKNMCKNLYEENYKILMNEEIKELNKWMLLIVTLTVVVAAAVTTKMIMMIKTMEMVVVAMKVVTVDCNRNGENGNGVSGDIDNTIGDIVDGGW